MYKNNGFLQQAHTSYKYICKTYDFFIKKNNVFIILKSEIAIYNSIWQRKIIIDRPTSIGAENTILTLLRFKIYPCLRLETGHLSQIVSCYINTNLVIKNSPCKTKLPLTIEKYPYFNTNLQPFSMVFWHEEIYPYHSDLPSLQCL